MAIEHELPNANPDQIKYWNSDTGKKWVTYQDGLDTILDSAKTRLLERTRIDPGDRVLDIGCGTGATTMAVAETVGENGQTIGVDISQTLLDCAEARKPNTAADHIQYLLADAQTYKFEKARFDLIISRFGMMFFEDPTAAFNNLSLALRSGGRLSFVCWSAATHNPWFHIPGAAAMEQLGKPAAADPLAPGPFAFADTDRVLKLMQDGNFVSCSAISEDVDLFYPGSVGETASLACKIGPAVRIVKEFNGSPEDIEAIERKTAEAFQAFEVDDGVRIPAKMNFFDATIE